MRGGGRTRLDGGQPANQARIRWIRCYQCHAKNASSSRPDSASNLWARFPNIVPDYLRQVEWRVAARLPRELATLGESLDHRKRVVPPVHTCYRIIRDLANIASYHAHGVYAGAPDDIARYYHEHWPWFEATFQTLRGYKTDARLRQEVFDDVAQGRPERLRSVRLCAQATMGLWEEFEAEYR